MNGIYNASNEAKYTLHVQHVVKKIIVQAKRQEDMVNNDQRN